MKKNVRTSINLTADMAREMDKHPLSRNVSKAGFARIAIHEKLERETMEKKTKNESENK